MQTMKKSYLKINQIVTGLLIVFALQGCVKKPASVIYINKEADGTEELAAYEIRKYFYLRTGELLPILEWNENKPINDYAIIVGSLVQLMKFSEYKIPELSSDAFILKTYSSPEGKKLLIFGGSNIGTLYAAYYLAEQLGVGFYLEGDIIPDEQIPFIFPELDIKQSALFSIRGIQPFHDFPEGPDWWSIDDYKSIIAQLPKLRMNFIGFHTYPEGGVGPEPMVWIGLPSNIDSYGKVKASYPSSHFSTLDGDLRGWGYEPMNTGEYYFGASQLFEKENFGADYMMDLSSYGKSLEQQNELFNKFGLLLSDAFTFAHRVGVKTCIGTETPLTIPRQVMRQLNSMGKDPKDPKVLQELYEGMFQRIKNTHPLDYYWFWTAENWLQGVNQSVIDATVSDLKSAVAAAEAIEIPYTLATCGWVLGPQQDRSLFDNFLPKNFPMSSINRGVGFTPVEPGFVNVQGRPKWAIPWLEDDPAMIIPQLWVGRMRRDAADALAYGCTGLIGIHWRTRSLGPNVSALAQAAWTQEGWNPDYPNPINPIESSEPDLKQYETGEKTRDLSSIDFYSQWAKISFGGEVSDKIADIFSSQDGGDFNIKERYKTNLPRPSTWVGGPGGINPDKRPWEEVIKDYQFVNSLEELRSGITGQGNLERFDYWLNQFKYLQEIGHLNCVWYNFNKVMQEIKEVSDPDKQRMMAFDKALPLRVEIVSILTNVQNYLLASITTYGGLGNVTNWQQHNIPRLIHEPGLLLEKYMGKGLPEEAKLPKNYSGPCHMFVSKVRTILEKGESLTLKIRTISVNDAIPADAKIYWRTLGESRYKSKELDHIARGVYEFQLDSQAIPEKGLEYYVQVKFKKGDIRKFPATAPDINQTIILLPQ
jgi:hypothetical protein